MGVKALGSTGFGCGEGSWKWHGAGLPAGPAAPEPSPGAAAALSPPWQVLLFVFAASGFITAGNTQVFFAVCHEIDTVISFLSHK